MNKTANDEWKDEENIWFVPSKRKHGRDGVYIQLICFLKKTRKSHDVYIQVTAQNILFPLMTRVAEMLGRMLVCMCISDTWGTWRGEHHMCSRVLKVEPEFLNRWLGTLCIPFWNRYTLNRINAPAFHRCYIGALVCTISHTSERHVAAASHVVSRNTWDRDSFRFYYSLGVVPDRRGSIHTRTRPEVKVWFLPREFFAEREIESCGYGPTKWRTRSAISAEISNRFFTSLEKIWHVLF